MQQRYRVILALCAVITSIESNNVVALPGLLFLRDLFLVLVLFCFFFQLERMLTFLDPPILILSGLQGRGFKLLAARDLDS